MGAPRMFQQPRVTAFFILALYLVLAYRPLLTSLNHSPHHPWLLHWSVRQSGGVLVLTFGAATRQPDDLATVDWEAHRSDLIITGVSRPVTDGERSVITRLVADWLDRSGRAHLDADAAALRAGRPVPRPFDWTGATANLLAWLAALGLLGSLGWVPTVARRHIRRVRVAKGQCAACGYSLRGLPADQCPECGATDSARTA